MSSQPDPVPHPRRRYLRFSVRVLIVLVLVVGAGLGWIVHQAHVQRDAVAAIEKIGGRAAYGSEFWDGNVLRSRNPWAPRWLRDFIGVDYLGHVAAVDLTSSPAATNSVMIQVGHLTSLHRLNAGGSSVSDGGLAHLKGLSNLSILVLDGTTVTDTGLGHLKGLTNLSYLALGRTQVSDAGLAHLEGLTKLSRLYLAGTRVTDAGLVHLKGLTNLIRLGLENTRVTDAGVNELKQALPRLTTISRLGAERSPTPSVR
jgi:hypothetical protein